ncbi:MAG: hypothetical protein AAF483_05245, partial [Planctomycetota bacterium]
SSRAGTSGQFTSKQVAAEDSTEPQEDSKPFRLASLSTEALPKKTAFQQLQQINWLATPNVAGVPKGEIERLHLLPEVSGVFGIVARAINQLLGYVVAYQPRLFLAAILCGVWMGWTVHSKLLALSGENESLPSKS